MKLVTWNIRCQNGGDDARGCGWKVRREPLCAIIHEQAPDILAVQEAHSPQVGDLQAALPSYQMAGVGRDDGARAGEFCAIFTRADRYEMRAQNTRWLSPTPAVPSFGWGAVCIRIATSVRLFDREIAREFEVWNAHFDHVSARARLESARLLKREITASDVPAILCGDFNSAPDDAPFDTLTENQELHDSRIWARHKRSGPQSTFCGFSAFMGSIDGPPVGEKGRIDYILADENWQIKSYAVLPTDENRFPVSDHRPVVVELQIK